MKVVIYVRLGEEPQVGIDISSVQEESLRAYARKNNLEVLDSISESEFLTCKY